MVDILIFVGLGFALGYAVAKVIMKEEPVGYLRVDTSDPDDGPYMFLELHEDPAYVMKRKHVTLEINTNNYVSQK